MSLLWLRLFPVNDQFMEDPQHAHQLVQRGRLAAVGLRQRSYVLTGGVARTTLQGCRGYSFGIFVLLLGGVDPVAPHGC